MAAAYSATKAAVIGVTKSIGKDVAGSGILVNCIAPAVIKTPILGEISQEHIDFMISRIPLGRIGEPSEVAALICFLASEEMTFSTGACFDLSGGRARIEALRPRGGRRERAARGPSRATPSRCSTTTIRSRRAGRRGRGHRPLRPRASWRLLLRSSRRRCGAPASPTSAAARRGSRRRRPRRRRLRARLRRRTAGALPQGRGAAAARSGRARRSASAPTRRGRCPSPSSGSCWARAAACRRARSATTSRSRDIEGANPLYLPQAKVYAGACALGPAVLVPDDWDAPFAIELRIAAARRSRALRGRDVDRPDAAELRASSRRVCVRDNPVPAGSVLLTGTGLVPPDEFTLEPGHTVEIRIAGIGLLANPVARAVSC